MDFIAKGLRPISYFEVEGRPAFKMALRRDGDTYLMYTGHLWDRGWSVLDVSEPHRPSLVRFIQGPSNRWTGQVDVSDDFLITGLEAIPEGWGAHDEDGTGRAGVRIWTLNDPRNPELMASYDVAGGGTHRNLIDKNGLAHLAINREGVSGRYYEIVDCNALNSVEPIASFRLPEQAEATAPDVSVSLHGPPIPMGDLVYLPYGGAGLVIVRQEAGTHAIWEVGRLNFSPPFLAHIGVHSALPLTEGNLTLVCSEAISEDCREPLGHISLVDSSDPTAPRLLSVFPVPRPSQEEPYPNYCAKGGRFGPHNFHLQVHNAGASSVGSEVYATYFNAGLRIYDISDPHLPVEVGFFVPPDPIRRYGTHPVGRLVAQSEDVIVDDRGFIYVSHKNQGIWCLQRDPDLDVYVGCSAVSARRSSSES